MQESNVHVVSSGPVPTEPHVSSSARPQGSDERNGPSSSDVSWPQARWLWYQSHPSQPLGLRQFGSAASYHIGPSSVFFVLSLRLPTTAVLPASLSGVVRCSQARSRSDKGQNLLFHTLQMVALALWVLDLEGAREVPRSHQGRRWDTVW